MLVADIKQIYLNDIMSKLAEIMHNALAMIDGYHALLQILIIIVAIGIFIGIIWFTSTMIAYFCALITALFIVIAIGIICVVIATFILLIILCFYGFVYVYEMFEILKSKI